MYLVLEFLFVIFIIIKLEPTEAINPRHVNVNLETLLEFNGKETSKVKDKIIMVINKFKDAFMNNQINLVHSDIDFEVIQDGRIICKEHLTRTSNHTKDMNQKKNLRLFKSDRTKNRDINAKPIFRTQILSPSDTAKKNKIDQNQTLDIIKNTQYNVNLTNINNDRFTSIIKEINKLEEKSDLIDQQIKKYDKSSVNGTTYSTGTENPSQTSNIGLDASTNEPMDILKIKLIKEIGKLQNSSNLNKLSELISQLQPPSPTNGSKTNTTSNNDPRTTKIHENIDEHESSNKTLPGLNNKTTSYAETTADTSLKTVIPNDNKIIESTTPNTDMLANINILRESQSNTNSDLITNNATEATAVDKEYMSTSENVITTNSIDITESDVKINKSIVLDNLMKNDNFLKVNIENLSNFLSGVKKKYEVKQFKLSKTFVDKYLNKKYEDDEENIPDNDIEAHT